MNWKSFLAFCSAIVFCQFWPIHASADYIGLVSGAVRIRNDGSLSPTCYACSLPQSIWQNIESLDGAVALTPDLKTTYIFANSLGVSNYVVAVDTASGAFDASKTFQTGPAAPPPFESNYILAARQPLIVGNELFVASEVYNVSNSWQIKHFDLATKSYIDAINPPTPQSIDDIASRSFGLGGVSDLLYFSTPSGLFRYLRNALPLPSFQPSGTPFIPGVEGNITIGPDNLLYVRNFANNNVERYNSLTGSFVDTFISHTNYPNLTTIDFGIDGNLHAYQDNGAGSPSRILTFSGANGSLLFSTPRSVFGGRTTYIPVPEPGPGSLLFAGFMSLASVFVRINTAGHRISLRAQ